MEDKKIKEQKPEKNDSEKPVVENRKVRLSGALRQNLQRRKAKTKPESK